MFHFMEHFIFLFCLHLKTVQIYQNKINVFKIIVKYNEHTCRNGLFKCPVLGWKAVVKDRTAPHFRSLFIRKGNKNCSPIINPNAGITSTKEGSEVPASDGGLLAGGRLAGAPVHCPPSL